MLLGQMRRCPSYVTDSRQPPLRRSEPVPVGGRCRGRDIIAWAQGARMPALVW